MLPKAKPKLTNFHYYRRLLTFVSLTLLLLFLFLIIYRQDQLANVVLAFIYLFMVLLLMFQILEYLRDPKHFDLPFEENLIKNFINTRVNLLGDHGYRGRYLKRFNHWQRLINILALIVFFLIFGISQSAQENYSSFFSLALAIVFFNLLMFFYDFGRPKGSFRQTIGKFSRPNRQYSIKKIFSNRNTVMIVLINLCLFLIFLLLYGFDFQTLAKALSLLFILLIINGVLLADARNEKYNG
ncbi:MAG: hypothetical protein RB292_03020 [Patescibacteria group bacterium]|jgi:hypothetical protein|nr:hypothetical protein [Patescibacteria group bacterium]